MSSTFNLIRMIVFLPLNLFNSLILNIARVKHQKLKVVGILVISNSGSIVIGAKTRINSSKYKNVIGGDTRTSFVVKKEAELIIGENVKISNTAFYCAEKITIGNNVMIGGSTKIWDTDFHPLNPQERLANANEGYKTRPIIIHNNAFIGGFCIILKGSVIGENAVVGAGSVVSGKIPANEIWAGNPAKFVKKLVE